MTMAWVGVGTAVVGAAGSIYEGSQNEKAANAARKADAWRGAAGQDLVSRSQTIADRPYTAYTGERVAGLDANEIKAHEIAAENSGPDSPAAKYYDKAGAQADFVANNGWSDATAKKYMDPYIGEVVDQSLRKEQDTYATQENARKGQSAEVGAFGGDRDAILEAQGEKAHNQNVADITTAGYSDAYRNAVGTWQADNNRALAAGRAYEAVGGDITKMNSDQISDLIKTGQSSRLLQQAQLDVNFSDAMEKRDWSVTNLQPLMKAVGEANGSPNTPYTESHKVGQTIGALATIAGYFGQQNESSYQADAKSVNQGMDTLYGNTGSYFNAPPPTEIGGGENGSNAAMGGY